MDQNQDNDRESSKFYFDLWKYQDGLLWSRLQTLATLQAGVMAGCYALKKDEPALADCLVLFGALLSLMLWFLAYRDQEARDFYSNQFAKKMNPRSTPIHKSSLVITWPPKARFVGGSIIILIVIAVFCIADVIVFIMIGGPLWMLLIVLGVLTLLVLPALLSKK